VQTEEMGSEGGSKRNCLFLQSITRYRALQRTTVVRESESVRVQLRNELEIRVIIGSEADTREHGQGFDAQNLEFVLMATLPGQHPLKASELRLHSPTPTRPLFSVLFVSFSR
jgi:hypothetical protein